MHTKNIAEDIAFLTDGIVLPLEARIGLRPSLEGALFHLGYAPEEVRLALDTYYSGMRTLH